MLDCILGEATAVNESALGNNGQAEQCGHDPLAVDIDGRGCSALRLGHIDVWPRPDTSQRAENARSTANDGGHIVVWPG